jgi:hypothetical protein
MCDSKSQVGQVEGFQCVVGACQSAMKCGLPHQMPCCDANCANCYCDFAVVKYGTPYWSRCLGSVNWEACSNSPIPSQPLGSIPISNKWLYGTNQWIDTNVGAPPIQKNRQDYCYFMFLPFTSNVKVGDPVTFGDKVRIAMANRPIPYQPLSDIAFWNSDYSWVNMDPGRSQWAYQYFTLFPYNAQNQGLCLRQGMGFAMSAVNYTGSTVALEYDQLVNDGHIRGDACRVYNDSIVLALYNLSGFPDGVMATKTCESDSDCPSGKSCKSGVCVAPPPPPPNPTKQSPYLIPLLFAGGFLLFMFLRKKRSSSTGSSS